MELEIQGHALVSIKPLDMLLELSLSWGWWERHALARRDREARMTIVSDPVHGIVRRILSTETVLDGRSPPECGSDPDDAGADEKPRKGRDAPGGEE